MTNKPEVEDPGVDEQVRVERIHETADLTHIVNGLWPGNPPNRTGNFYIDLNRLEMEAGQMGLLGNLSENFVFERVDMHVIRPADTDCSLEIQLEDRIFLDGFKVMAGCLKTLRLEPDKLGKVPPGTFAGKEKIYLKLNDDAPQQGRMLINFVGYLIEPWR